MLIPSSLHHFQVDLFQLQVNTLRRYKRHYKLQTRPGLNKAQLAEVSEDRSRVTSVIKKLFISSAQVRILWTLIPVVALSLVCTLCSVKGFRGWRQQKAACLLSPETVMEDIEAGSWKHVLVTCFSLLPFPPCSWSQPITFREQKQNLVSNGLGASWR